MPKYKLIEGKLIGANVGKFVEWSQIHQNYNSPILFWSKILTQTVMWKHLSSLEIKNVDYEVLQIHIKGFRYRVYFDYVNLSKTVSPLAIMVDKDEVRLKEGRVWWLQITLDCEDQMDTLNIDTS